METAALMALIALARIAHYRHRLKGLPWAIAALSLAIPSAVLGAGLLMALKA